MKKLNAMSILILLYWHPDWLYDWEEIADQLKIRADVYRDKILAAIKMLREMGYIDKEIKVPFIGHTITSLGKEIVSSYYRCQKSSSH